MQRSSTSPRSFSPFLNPGAIIPGWGGPIDWQNIPDDYLANTFNVQLNGAVIAGATTITVDPIPVDLKDQQILRHATGPIVLNADAKKGATSLSVDAVDFAMADNAILIGQAPNQNLVKRVRRGTVMARHNVSGLLIPRAAATAGETAIGFLVDDADENSKTDSKSGYGLVIGGTQILENLLPDADLSGNLSNTYKTELATNGVVVQYLDYTDDTDNTP